MKKERPGTHDGKDARSRGHALYKGALLALIVLLLAFALLALWKSGVLDEIRSAQQLRALISGAGPTAWVVYFLLQMTTVILAPLPSNVVMLAGSLALGFRVAFPLGMVAIDLASLLTFFVARRLGRNAARRLISHSAAEKYVPLIEEKQGMFLFLTMLFPFFPDDMLCLLAGLTGIPAWRFALILLFARPWGLAFAALLGSGVISLPAWGWALLVLAIAVLFGVMLKYSERIESALLHLYLRLIKRKKRE